MPENTHPSADSPWGDVGDPGTRPGQGLRVLWGKGASLQSSLGPTNLTIHRPFILCPSVGLVAVEGARSGFIAIAQHALALMPSEDVAIQPCQHTDEPWLRSLRSLQRPLPSAGPLEMEIVTR